MAHFSLAVALDLTAKRGFGDLTSGRPHLAAWLKTIHARPAYQRALEVGGPYDYA